MKVLKTIKPMIYTAVFIHVYTANKPLPQLNERPYFTLLNRPSTFCKVGDFVPLGGRSIGAGLVGEKCKIGFWGLFFIFEKNVSLMS